MILGLLNLDFDFIANSELILDVLRTSHAAEDSTTDHDSHLGSQGFCFFHRVRRQNDCRFLVTLGDLFDNLPHEATSFGIHSSRRLIQQNDGRVTNEGHSDRKLPLVTSTESASKLVSVVLEIKCLDGLLDNTLDLVCLDSFDQSVELESLFNSQFRENRIVLGTIAN